MSIKKIPDGASFEPLTGISPKPPVRVNIVNDPKVIKHSASPIKKISEEESLTKKLKQSIEASKYAPEYTGKLFIGTSNNFTVPGASAYEIAVANGFVGTETQWLDSLSASTASRSLESKDLIYNVSDQLSQVVTVSGTKTLSYDVDGILTSVSDTDGNILKTLTYDIDGRLDEVQLTFF